MPSTSPVSPSSSIRVYQAPSGATLPSKLALLSSSRSLRASASSGRLVKPGPGRMASPRRRWRSAGAAGRTTSMRLHRLQSELFQFEGVDLARGDLAQDQGGQLGALYEAGGPGELLVRVDVAADDAQGVDVGQARGVQVVAFADAARRLPG